MKALQVVNLGAFALAATLALTLAAVSLMYVVNLDASPRMAAEWPTVAGITVVSWVVALCCGVSVWSQQWAGGLRRRVTQTLGPISVVIGLWTVRGMLHG